MSAKKTFSPDMVANNITPAYPTHPGEVLKDEIEFRGISQRQLAKDMGIAYSALNEILNARRPVTEKTALLFEAALGVNAEPLLRKGCRCVIIFKSPAKIHHLWNVLRKSEKQLLYSENNTIPSNPRPIAQIRNRLRIYNF